MNYNSQVTYSTVASATIPWQEVSNFLVRIIDSQPSISNLMSYNILMKTEDLLRRVEKLEKRNSRVEGDKAWETSWFRRICIMAMTYLVVVFYLRFVVHIDPWVNALVPVIGFTFSTLTLSLLKQWWLDRRNSKKS
jgi:phosphate/sulfate permease